jgi:hypothetical protein
MENLENKIIRNRAAFDNAEPGDGHYDRFIQKLGQISQARRSSIPYYIKVAVVLLLVSISSIMVYEMIIQPRFERNMYSFGKLSPEYREVEDYFIRSINIKYNNIQNLDLDDKVQKDMILKELKEMDKVYQSLSKELENDPNNERLINAMIQHYQLKLDILNDITNQLEIIKNAISNNKQNENKDL